MNASIANVQHLRSSTARHAIANVPKRSFVSPHGNSARTRAGVNAATAEHAEVLSFSAEAYANVYAHAKRSVLQVRPLATKHVAACVLDDNTAASHKCLMITLASVNVLQSSCAEARKCSAPKHAIVNARTDPKDVHRRHRFLTREPVSVNVLRSLSVLQVNGSTLQHANVTAHIQGQDVYHQRYNYNC